MIESSTRRPTVTIVGAGLGGLLLGALLEQIGLPYHIYEQAAEPRPLGAAMALGATILPVFEQLGLLAELEKIAFPVKSTDLYKSNMELYRVLKLLTPEETGYHPIIFERPRLYNLLRSQIPASKLTLGKKIIRTEEKEGQVFIHCSDNTTFQGDILVGADGAYSGVRQSLYKRMDEQDLLPKSDLDELSIGHVCMVGVAEAKDPSKYPQLKDRFCHFSAAHGQNLRTYTVVSVPDNRICWSLARQLSYEDARAQQSCNAEWGPEANEAMIKEFADLPCPWGGKMIDVIDMTPKHLISKVFLEEKVFDTWHHGRTVLLGDACHKMRPAGGLGAVNAMQDAVVLANCLYAMTDNNPDSITVAFQTYRSQRYHRAVAHFESSKRSSKIMFGQSWMEQLVRHVMMNYVPDWILLKQQQRNVAYRPQIAWLPLIENRGSIPVQDQEGQRGSLIDQTTSMQQYDDDAI
ncbi:hypothetical protein EDD11_008953 [Mortierella claussenii]|nr:hypothetical protein EDD11_008953 [Mortierella claussenii]